MQKLKSRKKRTRSWIPKRWNIYIYIIARVRDKKSKELCIMKCVKDEDLKILVQNNEIKKMNILKDYSMEVLLKIQCDFTIQQYF